MYISVRNNCKTSSGNQTSSNFYRNHTSLQQGVEDDLLLDFRGQAGPAPTHWWVCRQALAGTSIQLMFIDTYCLPAGWHTSYMLQDFANKLDRAAYLVKSMNE